MGRMFEVEITDTGKHYLVGEVVRQSLVHMPSRPPPLPYGTISGPKQTKSSGTRTASIDRVLIAVALLIVCVAVFVHYSQIVSAFR